VLEGTLDSFTLPDVFQLLAFTKKSGCLRLRDDAERGRVFFETGQVTYALSSHGRLALGRRLVGAGLVTTEQLQGALAKQQEDRGAGAGGAGLRLGQYLVEMGAVDEETLATFVREQIQDAVFDLMRWTTGAFSFDQLSEVDEPIQLSVTVENLIMEGSRRLEEWEQVRRKIPSLDAVVAMAPTPGDNGVEVNLKPEEWRLLSVVDGRRTVGELVELFGQGEFQTCRVLYGLAGAGLLEVRDPDVEGPPSIHALLQQQELLRALEDAGEPTDGETEEDDLTPAPPADPDPGPSDAPEQEPAATDEEPEVDGPGDDDGPATDGDDGAAVEPRLTTDPSIDADLVRRLIEGVKGL
jgi:hypothetical protein